MKFNNKVILGIAVVFLIIAVRFFTSGKPVKVTVAKVESNLAVEVFGIGTSEAKVVSNVAFKERGLLVSLLVDQGDLVKAGDLLARIDDREQVARVKKSQLEVNKAQASLTQIKLTEVKAKTTFQYKKTVAQRHANLIKDKSISQELFDASQNDKETSQVEWQIAKSNIIFAQSALESAQAELLLQKVILENYQLIAPYDAVVLSRQKEFGAMLNSGETLFTLVDPESAWVRAYIDESRVGSVAVGQPVIIHYRSKMQKAFKGVVARINMESSRINEEFSVYVRCIDCSKEAVSLHLGEQVEVIITTEMMNNVIAIPESAVQTFDVKKMTGDIWLVENEKLALKTVTFIAKTLDARLVINDNDLSAERSKISVINKREDNFTVGRQATIVSESATQNSSAL
jgi:HlyD family secretion protein